MEAQIERSARGQELKSCKGKASCIEDVSSLQTSDAFENLMNACASPLAAAEA